MSKKGHADETPNESDVTEEKATQIWHYYALGEDPEEGDYADYTDKEREVYFRWDAPTEQEDVLRAGDEKAAVFLLTGKLVRAKTTKCEREAAHCAYIVAHVRP